MDLSKYEFEKFNVKVVNLVTMKPLGSNSKIVAYSVWQQKAERYTIGSNMIEENKWGQIRIKRNASIVRIWKQLD